MTQTSTPAPNCYTATGTVHAAITERDGRPRPACAGRSVNGYHFAAPTNREITCRRCLGAAPRAASPEDKKARAAELRAADKRRALEQRAAAPARAAAGHAERTAFLAAAAADEARTPEQRAAAAADLFAEAARYAALCSDAQLALAALA